MSKQKNLFGYNINTSFGFMFYLFGIPILNPVKNEWLYVKSIATN